MAKNKVIAGDYNGSAVTNVLGSVMVGSMSFAKYTVDDYEVITEDHRKSAASGIARGIVGGSLLGPVGMLAGSLSAKNKGVYTVAVAWKDGKKSLIEVDDKIYKAMVKVMF
ncbi:MAG: hypothetical protein J6K17_14705 [Oscillospiraceae bacterium]|nr:hypothetical protein [Oscillospiraceae bacterium]